MAYVRLNHRICCWPPNADSPEPTRWVADLASRVGEERAPPDERIERRAVTRVSRTCGRRMIYIYTLGKSETVGPKDKWAALNRSQVTATITYGWAGHHRKQRFLRWFRFVTAWNRSCTEHRIGNKIATEPKNHTPNKHINRLNRFGSVRFFGFRWSVATPSLG